MPSRYRALVLVAAFSGLRWGELVGLRRKRIDLEAGTVMVAEQLVEVNGTFSVGPPKSPAGGRTVLRVHDLCLPPAPGHRRRRLATRGHAPAGPRHHRGGGALPARHGRPSTVACSPSSPSSAPDQTFESERSTARKGPGLHRNACAAGGQDLGTGSSRTQTVNQGSTLHPSCARPTPPRTPRRPATPVQPAPIAERISVPAGQSLCGAPRRNRTGDPILTMEPPGTAVRIAVVPGRARP
jgi:hypothetical protein